MFLQYLIYARQATSYIFQTFQPVLILHARLKQTNKTSKSHLNIMNCMSFGNIYVCADNCPLKFEKGLYEILSLSRIGGLVMWYRRKIFKNWTVG